MVAQRASIGRALQGFDSVAERIKGVKARVVAPMGKADEGHAFLWEVYGGVRLCRRLKGVLPENLWLGFNLE